MSPRKTTTEKGADDFSKPLVESDAVRSFKEKCETALRSVSDVQQFRDEDTMIDFVFKCGRELFDTPLDQHNLDRLLRTGGKLTGAYVYLGQKSARARAERDVYAQKRDEHEKQRLLELLHAGVKVTEARAAVSGEIVELNDFVVRKDISKNQWENITEATEKMVSFIQSAIRVKEGERYQSSKVMGNQG